MHAEVHELIKYMVLTYIYIIFSDLAEPLRYALRYALRYDLRYALRYALRPTHPDNKGFRDFQKGGLPLQN